MRHASSLVLVAAMAAASSTGFADESAIPLPEITVSGTMEDGYVANSASTATKTSTPLIETPVSVQVLTRELMDDTQAVRMKDVVQYTSGVISFNPAGSLDYDNFVIRGFYDFNLTSIYRNGLQTRRAAFETANLERIEVLKGPSSVLFGRTEPGGLINRVTKIPKDSFSAELGQQFGSFNNFRTTLDITGPLDDDKRWLGRVVGVFQDTDTFYDINHQRRYFVAPSLTFRLSPNTEFEFNAEYKNDRQRYYDGIPVIGSRPAPIPIDTFLGFGGDNEFEDMQTAIAEFAFTHRFNENWMARGRYHHQWLDYQFNTYFSFGMVNARQMQRGIYFEPYDRTDLDQSNLELLGTIGRHKVLVGVDWHHYRDRQEQFCCGAALNNLVDIFNPTYEDYPVVTPDAFYGGDERWIGIYFQDQIDIGERLHLLLGGRNDWARKESGFSSTDLHSLVWSGSSEQQFSPRAGAVLDLAEGLATYVSYSESFGVNNGRGVGGTVLEPESAQQEEIGIKYERDGLMASAAIYNLTKQNLTAPDIGNPGFNVAGGEARSRGIELDVSARIAEHWKLIGSYSYTDAELTSDSNLGPEGNRLIAVPRHMAGLWTQWDAMPDEGLGLSANLGIYAAGEREVDYANTAQLPGYARVDTGLAYRWKLGGQRLSTQFGITNLFDRRYFESGGYGTAGVTPGAPRTFTGTVKLEF